MINSNKKYLKKFITKSIKSIELLKQMEFIQKVCYNSYIFNPTYISNKNIKK